MSLKILVAVLTCARYLDRRNACRDTWFPWVERLNENVTAKFFAGNVPCLADDDVGDITHLYCSDGYQELPQKTLRLVEYAVANNFDFLVKADDDTFLMPLPEYLAALTAHDYVGNVRQHAPHNDNVDYAQGGLYCLSRVAMEAVLKHGLPAIGLEDGNVGKALKAAGILPVNLPERVKTDYRHGTPAIGNDVISAHSCTAQILHEIFAANQIQLLARYNEFLNKQHVETPDSEPNISLVEAKPNEDQAVTIVVQSCGRLDLLKRTLDSLSKCAIDYPICETIIYEDSDTKRPDWLREYRTLGLGEIRWIPGGARVGQWMACDRLLDEVKTEYILRVEDDFVFLPEKSAFLSRSIDILKRYPTVIQVSLRGSDTTSGHPIVDDVNYPEFKIQERYWRKVWGGWSGNNHVARMSDRRRIGSYGRVGGYGKPMIAVEEKLSKLYLDLGFSIAVLPGGPYIQHLGERRSKAIDKLPSKPKVLIAVPACWKYEYGTHAKDLRPGVVRDTRGRIDAVRQTWGQDVKAFSDYVDLRFFYGKPPDKTVRLKPDEISLDVPDDYHNLPFKMQAIYKWALQHGYEYIVKADDDTFLYIDRLLRSGFESYDQMGYFRCRCRDKNRCQDYITGMCYTLNKRALQILAATKPVHWAEDCSTGKILRARRIKPTGHHGWLPGFEKHFVDVDSLPANHNYIALHAVRAEDMGKLYGK